MKKNYIGITRPLNIVSTPEANLDAKYGPYDSITEAINELPKELRAIGLTIGIKENGIVDYWWKHGVEDKHLIIKLDKIPTKTSDIENDLNFVDDTSMTTSLNKLDKTWEEQHNATAKSLVWQNPVTNISDLKIKYPNPEIGDASMVTSVGYIYSWNGKDWANTGLTEFPDNVASKTYVDDIALTIMGAKNDNNSFFIISDNTICIKNSAFDIYSKNKIVYTINKSKVTPDGTIIGKDLTFTSNKNGNGWQHLVLDTTKFINGVAWINDENLIYIVEPNKLTKDHIILCTWYKNNLLEDSGLIKNTYVNSDYTNKLSIIPYMFNKLSIQFNDIRNKPDTTGEDVIITLSSFLMVYKGINYKIILDSPKTFINNFTDASSEFLIALKMNVSNILLDISLTKDSEGFRTLYITDATLDKYFYLSKDLSSTSNEGKSTVFNKNEDVILISMYKREPIGGLLYEYYSRYNIEKFRDKQYFIMSEFGVNTGDGIYMIGDTLTINYMTIYESDFEGGKTNYYQLLAKNPIVINLKEGDTPVIDLSILSKNTINNICLDTDAIEGAKPAIKIKRYGEYSSNDLVIAMRRAARLYINPVFSDIFLKNKLQISSNLFAVASTTDTITFSDNSLYFNIEQALFIYANNMYANNTKYFRINFDITKLDINEFETVVIDTTKIKWDSDLTNINYVSEVFKKVTFGRYLATDIPIVHIRKGGVYFYPTFLPLFINNLEGSNSTIYDSNKNDFLPYYNSVQETKYNGWKKRLNILHISDIHIGSEDASTNLEESIKITKEPNMNIHAYIGTGDLTVGFKGAVEHINTLNQLKTCRDIVLKSNIPALMQLGNHDANDADKIKDNATTKKEQWDSIFSELSNKWTNIQWGDKENFRHYHYYDIIHSLGNVRVIMLDQLDHDLPVNTSGQLVYTCQNDPVYSQKQMDWLCNTLNNTPEDYGVIIGNHYIYAERSTGETLLVDGDFVQGWQMIPDIVEAWSNKTTLNKAYIDTVGNQDININYTFSNINREFICHLCGHTHFRTHELIKGYNQLMIMEDSSGQRGNKFSKFVRIKKTSTSNAFSILSIDRKERKVYRTSYGAYKNYDEVDNNRIEIINY